MPKHADLVGAGPLITYTRCQEVLDYHTARHQTQHISFRYLWSASPHASLLEMLITYGDRRTHPPLKTSISDHPHNQSHLITNPTPELLQGLKVTTHKEDFPLKPADLGYIPVTPLHGVICPVNSNTSQILNTYCESIPDTHCYHNLVSILLGSCQSHTCSLTTSTAQAHSQQ